MTGSTTGRTNGQQPPDGPGPTVFGARDQDEMIARLDAVAEDDLDSDFFSTSVQDAEAAAVRTLDLGIRTLADDPLATDARPTGAIPFARSGPAGPVPSGEARPTPAASASAPTDPAASRRREPRRARSESRSPAGRPDFADPATAAAFILGGPAALHS